MDNTKYVIIFNLGVLKNLSIDQLGSHLNF